LSDKHKVHTLIFIAVIASLISTWLLGFMPAIWNACKSVFIWLFNFLLSSVSLPLWSIVIISLFILPTLIKIFSWFRQKDVNHPNWRDYNQDVLFEMRWRWNYSPYGGGIANISCFCPSDDTELVYEDWGSKVVYRCETCGRQFGPIEGHRNYVIGKVERQIHRKIRTGEWKDVLQRLT
jgi:hypothetical protein